MLRQLFIQNIALIDTLSIEFGPGLNILTGETGAGKSIIVDAVNLILGGRTDRDLVKTGTEKALVEGAFDITENEKIITFLDHIGIELADEHVLILTREITMNGKNTCRANGRMITLAHMKEISNYLVDIHGQHEHQSLLNANSHMTILDKFGGTNLQSDLLAVSGIYHQWKDVSTALSSMMGHEQEREHRMDLLRYQTSEIESAALKKDEDEEITKQRNLFINSEKITNVVNRIYQALYEGYDNNTGILNDVRKMHSELSELAHYDMDFINLQNKTDDIYYSLEDIAIEIRNSREKYEYDPTKLDEIEIRLDIINKLKRKYGKTIDEINVYYRNCMEDLNKLENNDHCILELKKERQKYFIQLQTDSQHLSQMRKNVAIEFQSKVIEQLQELGLGKCLFEVFFHEADIGLQGDIDEALLTEKGYDHIEFLISPNPGEPLRPLVKIASGGEMSRIMLALKSIMAHIDEIPSLIFDEIDTGVSGKMAQVVAEKMIKLSRNHQILCITHLPQIAAMGDTHFLIEKQQDEQSTKTNIKTLSMIERYHEIAKMVGGISISSVSLDHAKQMVDWAVKYKAQV